MSEDDSLTAEKLKPLFESLDHHPQRVYEELMAVETLDNLILHNQLSAIGLLIDVATDLGEEDGLVKGLDLAEELDEEDGLTEAYRAELYYSVGNAYSSLRQVRRRTGDDWRWENEELEHEIRLFRKALVKDRIETIAADRQCRILTNLGNALSGVGRFIEAIDYWNDALEEESAFAQARGQRGIGYYSYAQAHYDSGHQFLLLKHAYRDLTAALDQSARLFPRMIEGFQGYVEAIESMLSPEQLSAKPDLDDCSLGDSTEEQAYRQWCLDHRLFLNPLNDLGAYPIAAQDILQLASVSSTDENRIISCIGLYNLMKQEFVSARYQLYDGLFAEDPHFSDRDVALENTLDYPAHSLAVEKTKMAFRIAYSIFDKIGYFLNYYFDRSIPEHRVGFKRIWYTSRSRDTLASEFEERKNWPLRGLFWLSKDLEYKNPMYVQDSLDPGAKELADLRNGLEHRYIKLHDIPWTPEGDSEISRLVDELATSLHRETFEQHALEMLQKVRAALVYLSLAIRTEEQAKKEDTDGEYGRLHFGSIDDEWKR